MLENSPADATQLPTSCQPESLAKPARRRSHSPNASIAAPRKSPAPGAGGEASYLAGLTPPVSASVGTQEALRTPARIVFEVAFPAHAAFPKWQEGRHPHCHFRGLLRLHSHYGPPDRSAAHRRPLSRGSSPCGCPHEPLVSYRINRQLSGWILPPLMIRAFGAHCQQPTCASG
jgi:hypothetical protein